MKTLRLLAVIEASSITGPAKNLLEFARVGRESGVETIIATFTRESEDNLFIRTARQLEIPVEAIREKGPGDPAALYGLGEVVRRFNPDILQTHAVKSHFLVRRARLDHSTRWVAFHHGYTWPTFRARMYNQLDRWSLRKARRVLTVSLPFCEQLVAHGVKREKIEVIHNAIPPTWGSREGRRDELAALRQRLEIPDGRKIILIVGRLSQEKNHVTLLEAISRLPSSAEPHLLIVGDGPERRRIESQIARLSLGSRVTFTGQQGSAEPYYGIADLAVLSSLSEGSPNALLEAMAAGVPAVATAVGGVPEIVVDGESALLVPPGHAAKMAAALARILSDPELACHLVEKSKAAIRDRHSPEQRTRKVIASYRRVIGSE